MIRAPSPPSSGGYADASGLADHYRHRLLPTVLMSPNTHKAEPLVPPIHKPCAACLSQRETMSQQSSRTRSSKPVPGVVSNRDLFYYHLRLKVVPSPQYNCLQPFGTVGARTLQLADRYTLDSIPRELRSPFPPIRMARGPGEAMYELDRREVFECGDILFQHLKVGCLPLLTLVGGMWSMFASVVQRRVTEFGLTRTANNSRIPG